MQTTDEECANCGELVEVEIHIEGECPRCGSRYWWEEYFNDDEYDYDEPMIVWE